MDGNVHTKIDLKKNICDYKYKLLSLGDKLNNYNTNLEKYIFKMCSHEWIREFGSYDEHVTYVCTKCGLYNNCYWYK